jgi:hypothetical protein
MPGKPSAYRPACRANTKAGKPCKAKAAAGSAYCAVHGGATGKVGAPLKLDHGVINAVVEVIQRGVTWEVAAQAIGVHRSTLAEWRTRGELDREEGKPTVYADLADALTRATAEGEASLIRVIRSHALLDWRAAAWLLERRHRERWASKVTIDAASSELAEPRTVAPADGKRESIVAILAKATAKPAGADE